MTVTPPLLSAVFGDDFNLTHNVSIEFFQLFRRYPILLVFRPANHSHLIPAEIIIAYAEAGHVPNLVRVVLRIPVTCDLFGISFIEHGVEDWLLRQTRWETSVATLADEGKLALAHRAVEQRCIRITHPICFTQEDITPELRRAEAVS